VSEEFPDHADSRTEGGAWVVWGVLVAIAIAIYEIAQQPALLGITIALKFAWGDARTGWWIRRRDPNRTRGADHFRLYLGYGLWKAAGAAFVLGILFASIDNFVRQPAAKPAPQNLVFFNMVVGSVLGSLALAYLGSVSCFMAFWSAVRGNFKLWLNSRVAADRVRDRWPPTQGETNAVVWMGYATSLALMLLFVVVLLVLFVWLTNKLNAAVVGIVLLVAFPAIVMRFAKTLDRGGYEHRFRAASPDEAWFDVQIGAGPRI
jgi:hypothetical protein